MTEFAAAEWQRAQRTLASAEQLLKSDPDSTASLAYYAAFHAVSALFALRGQSFSKHSAVRAAVHRDLVHAEGWPAEIGEIYDTLMELRADGDCGGAEHVSLEDARAAVEMARSVIEAVRKAAPEL